MHLYKLLDVFMTDVNVPQSPSMQFQYLPRDKCLIKNLHN